MVELKSMTLLHIMVELDLFQDTTLLYIDLTTLKQAIQYFGAIW